MTKEIRTFGANTNSRSIASRYSFFPQVLVDARGALIDEKGAIESELKYKRRESLTSARATAAFWRNMDHVEGGKTGLKSLQELTSVGLVLRQNPNETPSENSWRLRWQYEWCLHYHREICASANGIVSTDSHIDKLLSKALVVVSTDQEWLSVLEQRHGARLHLVLATDWPTIVSSVERALGG